MLENLMKVLVVAAQTAGPLMLKAVESMGKAARLRIDCRVWIDLPGSNDPGVRVAGVLSGEGFDADRFELLRGDGEDK